MEVGGDRRSPEDALSLISMILTKDIHCTSGAKRNADFAPAQRLDVEHFLFGFEMVWWLLQETWKACTMVMGADITVPCWDGAATPHCMGRHFILTSRCQSCHVAVDVTELFALNRHNESENRQIEEHYQPPGTRAQTGGGVRGSAQFHQNIQLFFDCKVVASALEESKR